MEKDFELDSLNKKLNKEDSALYLDTEIYIQDNAKNSP